MRYNNIVQHKVGFCPNCGEKGIRIENFLNWFNITNQHYVDYVKELLDDRKNVIDQYINGCSICRDILKELNY